MELTVVQKRFSGYVLCRNLIGSSTSKIHQKMRSTTLRNITGCKKKAYRQQQHFPNSFLLCFLVRHLTISLRQKQRFAWAKWHRKERKRKRRERQDSLRNQPPSKIAPTEVLLSFFFSYFSSYKKFIKLPPSSSPPQFSPNEKKRRGIHNRLNRFDGSLPKD